MEMRGNDEVNHMLKYFENNLRYDGRGLKDFRDITYELGVVKTAEGSASVRFGGTHVIAGVKLSIDQPYPDTPNKGNLMVEVSLSPLASENYMPGPPDIDSVEFSRVVDRGLREAPALDFEKLCIKEGEAVWNVSVDIVVINDDGNLIDVSGFAAMLALLNARFPKVVDGKVDYHELTDEKLPIKHIVVPTTIFKIDKYFFVDPILEEFQLSEARLTLTRRDDGKICAIQKGGDYPLKKEDITEMLALSKEKFDELIKIIKEVSQ